MVQKARASPAKQWHFIGIGGIGMSALAEYLLRRGNTVSGSDLTDNEQCEALRRLGARIDIPHAAQLPEGVERVVISTAIPEANGELQSARRQELPVCKRAQLLGEIASRLRCLAVAGTHGKTGTAALLAETLIGLGESPTAFVGGVMHRSGSNLLVGTGELCVCEADEYDGSFLELRPQLSIMTSLDHDHTDIYPTRRKLDTAFLDYLGQCELIIYPATPALDRLVAATGRPALSVGSGGTWELLTTEPAGGGQRVYYRHGKDRGEFELPLAGRHQAVNALLVLATLCELGFSEADAGAELARFQGVARRQETLLETEVGTLVDDYAHHPAEISALLTCFANGDQVRNHVLFQPHTFTRTRDFAAGFAEALTVAASVYLLPVFPAREAPLPGVDSRLIAAELERCNYEPVACGEDPLSFLTRHFQPGDRIITLGAGDIWRWHPQLKEFLQSQRVTTAGESS